MEINSKEEATTHLISWLDEFIADWGLDEVITPATSFNDDLCFSSVDMLHYLAVIDMHFKKKFPFEQLLMNNGVYRNELTVDELASFVCLHKDIVVQAPKAM